MELMQSNAARMATYGITISIPQLTLTLIANIKNATKAKYGRKFWSAMQDICKKYTYNHVHNATLLQDIMKELAGADGVHDFKDTPAPGTGTAHSVADSVSYLSAMMDANTDTDYLESAYAATSDSESYKEMRKRENDESDWIQVKHKNSPKTKLTSPVNSITKHNAYGILSHSCQEVSDGTQKGTENLNMK